jgi:hypothetical protein
VTIADEEQGYVVRYVDESAVVKGQRLKCWPTEILRGKVEIIDPEKKS